MRYVGAVVLGGLVTLVVLFTMQTLIATPKSKLDESGSRHFVDFVRVEREEITQRKERKRDKPAAPDAAPRRAIEPRLDTVEPGAVGVAVSAGPVEMEMSIGGPGLVASDGDYLPLVKIKPSYPISAQRRGIQGTCLVEYTVTTAGTVKDVVVIESQPKGVFDKVSVEAALKFKYRPRVVNGEPIEVRGVRNLFRFELES